MDLSAYKSLKVGGIELVKLVIGGVVAWAKKTFTNLVPLSTDTDGSIYNKTGYKDGVRLSSSGGVSSSSQPAGTTTGFIPWGGDSDILRLKGVEFLLASKNHSGHYYINFYNASKGFLAYLSSQEYGDGSSMDHILILTRDANGVETFDWNESYGTSNALLQAVRKAKFIRITAYGKGADMIVTINEEI
jgi:hypothetical protein